MANGEALQILLTACAQKDHTAFERLYRLTAPKLFSLCVRMLRREDLAEEVLQEAFVQIWRDAAQFDRRRAAPLTWMAAITRHRALDLLRRNTPEVSLQDHAADDAESSIEQGPEDPMSHWTNHEALRSCMERLSGRQREAVLLAFFQGLTHGEISQSLSTPIGTIKSWIRRGMDRLKRCLEP